MSTDRERERAKERESDEQGIQRGREREKLRIMKERSIEKLIATSPPGREGGIAEQTE